MGEHTAIQLLADLESELRLMAVMDLTAKTEIEKAIWLSAADLVAEYRERAFGNRERSTGRN